MRRHWFRRIGSQHRHHVPAFSSCSARFGFAVLLVFGAAALVTSGPAGVAGARSPGDKVVNGCTIVEKPTKEHHTVCATAFSSTDLTGLDLNWAVLTGSTFGARPDFTHTTFRDATLNGLQFVNATMVGTDMSGAQLVETQFRASNLENAKFIGATMTKTTFKHVEMPHVELMQAKVSGAEFRRTVALGNLTGVTGTGTIIADCMCSSVILDDAKLEHLTITGSDLPDSSDFRFGRMNGAHLEGAHIDHTRFSNMEMIGTQLQDSTFMQTTLHNSNLTRANFRHSTGITSLLGNTLCHTIDARGEEFNDHC